MRPPLLERLIPGFPRISKRSSSRRSRRSRPRYPTAEALASDLASFLADKPILASRAGVLERSWRWCRRNRAVAGLIGAGAVALLALGVLGVAMYVQGRLRSAYEIAEQQRLLAERERGRAERALANEQTFLYQNRILSAQRALEEDDVERAEQLLDECPANRRDWEWNYLKRQCRPEILSLAGHRAGVLSAATSPDGRFIASGADDGSIHIWNAETGESIRVLGGRERPVSSLAFSPDGESLASVGGSLDRGDRLVVRKVGDWTEIAGRDPNQARVESNKPAIGRPSQSRFGRLSRSRISTS